MQILPATILGFIAATTIIASAGRAHAQSCGDLWYERNAIYKAAGYCFKTPRAISTFGNAGCTYDSEYDLPLSPRQRARVAAIVRMEREYGCR